MPKKIFFAHVLNVSVQPGDMIMYATTDPSSASSFPQSGRNFTSSVMTKPIKYGNVLRVNHEERWVLVNNILGVPDPTEDEYIFFSKDRRANISGVIGYFAETKYVNDSKRKSEIFATAIDYVQSSS